MKTRKDGESLGNNLNEKIVRGRTLNRMRHDSHVTPPRGTARLVVKTLCAIKVKTLGG